MISSNPLRYDTVVEASNPESRQRLSSRDSGSGPSDHPGMTARQRGSPRLKTSFSGSPPRDYSARLLHNKNKSSGRTIIMHKGRVVFGAMEEVVFGYPAAEAIVAQMDRLGAARAFLMVSGTLNRQTGEIQKIRKALGSRCVATFDAMPPHTPREAVIAAAEQARAAGADLIVTVGGGSITDGAKAVQLCLANNVRTVEGIDTIPVHKVAAPSMTAPTVRLPTCP